MYHFFLGGCVFCFNKVFLCTAKQNGSVLCYETGDIFLQYKKNKKINKNLDGKDKASNRIGLLN